MPTFDTNTSTLKLQVSFLLRSSGFDAQTDSDFKSNLLAIANCSDLNHCDSICDFNRSFKNLTGDSGL